MPFSFKNYGLIRGAIKEKHNNVYVITRYVQGMDKRKGIFDYAKLLIQGKIGSIVMVTDFEEDIWEYSDKIIFNEIIDILVKLGSKSEVQKKYSSLDLNSLLVFLGEFHHENQYIFQKYPIIPSIKGQFQTITHLYEADNHVRIPQKLIDASARYLKYDIRDIMKDPEFTCVTAPWVYKLKDFIMEINSKLTTKVSSVQCYLTSSGRSKKTTQKTLGIENESQSNFESMALEIIQFLPSETSSDIYQNQEKVLKCAKNAMLIPINCQSDTLTGLKKDDWNPSNNLVIQMCVRHISSMDHINKLYNPIDLINTVISFHFPDENEKIIPNQNGKLCCRKDLYCDDDEISEEFKDMMASNFTDIRQHLIHSEINFDFHLPTFFIDFINKGSFHYLTNYYSVLEPRVSVLDQYDKASVALIHFAPERNDKFNKFIQCFKKITKQEFTVKYINADSSLWSQAIRVLAIQMAKYIQRSFNDVASFCKNLNVSNKEGIELINNLVSFASSVNFNSYKIFPNQNGLFLASSELYKDDGINDELKAYYKDVTGDDLRKTLLDSRIKFYPGKGSMGVFDVARTIKDSLKKCMQSWDFPRRSKDACISLVLDWLPSNPKLQKYFPYLSDFNTKLMIITKYVLTDRQHEKLEDVLNNNPRNVVQLLQSLAE